MGGVALTNAADNSIVVLHTHLEENEQIKEKAGMGETSKTPSVGIQKRSKVGGNNNFCLGLFRTKRLEGRRGRNTVFPRIVSAESILFRSCQLRLLNEGDY